MTGLALAVQDNRAVAFKLFLLYMAILNTQTHACLDKLYKTILSLTVCDALTFFSSILFPLFGCWLKSIYLSFLDQLMDCKLNLRNPGIEHGLWNDAKWVLNPGMDN